MVEWLFTPPLSEVNSTDLRSDWCGGGGGTDWCVGTLSQGIATKGFTPSEPNYRSVLGNCSFRTGPIPQQLLCLAFFRQAPFQLPHLLVLVVQYSYFVLICVESVLSQLNSLLPYSLEVPVQKIYRALLNIY
jgi:hypothetical protein